MVVWWWIYTWCNCCCFGLVEVPDQVKVPEDGITLQWWTTINLEWWIWYYNLVHREVQQAVVAVVPIGGAGQIHGQPGPNGASTGG